jgi:hypothetical protein
MPDPNEKMWIQLEKDFNQRWNFPNLTGAIDGKHVVIQAPGNNGSKYYCYKKHLASCY